MNQYENHIIYHLSLSFKGNFRNDDNNDLACGFSPEGLRVSYKEELMSLLFHRNRNEPPKAEGPAFSTSQDKAEY